MEEVPEEMLDSKERRQMWKKSREILEKLEKILPVSSVYLLGSFTTVKKDPADIDVVLVVKTDPDIFDEKWSLDIQLVPDNKYGKWMLGECNEWMEKKYGKDKCTLIKLK